MDQERNKQIKLSYAQHSSLTFQDLGAQYGLSKQRIHQIVKDIKEPKKIRFTRQMFCLACLKFFRKKYANSSQKFCKKHSYIGRTSSRDYTREIVRVRQNQTCQKCFKKWSEGRKFDVHHMYNCGKYTRRYDKLEHLYELITLCHKCHIQTHFFNRK